jgi:hypothetical protein
MSVTVRFRDGDAELVGYEWCSEDHPLVKHLNETVAAHYHDWMASDYFPDREVSLSEFVIRQLKDGEIPYISPRLKVPAAAEP